MTSTDNQRLHWLSRVLCLVVSLVGLWLVFRRIDLGALGAALLRLRVGWFIFGLLLYGLALTVAAFRWHLALCITGQVIHCGATARLAFIGHFFNTLLFGPTGGDIAKSALYARWHGVRMSQVLASAFLDRLLGLGGLIVFIGIAFALALSTGGFSKIVDPHLAVSRGWIWLGLIGVIVFGLGAAAHRRLFPNSALGRMLNTLHDGIIQLAVSPRLALLGLFLGALVQVICCGVMAVGLQAVSHQSLPWATLFWTFPVISIVAALPITVSGAGLRENAAFLLLGLYGIAGEDAVAAALLTLTTHLIWAGITGSWWWREIRLRQNLPFRRTPQTISLVIPTLNEAEALPETIRRARVIPEVSEIIVVDGGSQDGTREIAGHLGCRVFESAAGRGGQMRLGACEATGEVVLLLHADTWLPADAGQAVLQALRDTTVVGGGFWKVFQRPAWWMFGSRFRCGLRLYLFGHFMGDQGIFVRREVLEAMGGVPDLPLMEEFELCRKLRAAGRLALASATVVTSERRFRKRGVVRAYLRMWRVVMQYRLGTPVHELRQIYEKD
jgi:rSAM/selenodomain-associated transferase 2